MDNILDIHNISQVVDVQNIGSAVKDMIIERVDEVLSDGKIKISFILDPEKIKQEVK
jgi:hypothetical protein